MSKEAIIDMPTTGKTSNIVSDISRIRDKPATINNLDLVRDFFLELISLDY